MDDGPGALNAMANEVMELRAENAQLRAELSEVRSELTRTSVKLEDHRKQYAAMLRRRVENEEQWEAWMNEQVGGDALKGGGR